MSHVDIPAWIEANLFKDVLRTTIKDFKKIKQFKVFPALAPGENYATIMLKVQIEVELANGSLQTQSFMLKVAHDTELYHKEMSKWEIFVSEAGMYLKIKPEFEELYAQAGLDVQFGAKSYELAVDKEYILLEDLSVRGFRNAKRQDCLDLEHCQAVLKKLAQFHAASAVRVEQRGMFEKPYLHGFLKDESKNVCKTMFDTSLPYLIKTIKNLENNQDYTQQMTKLAPQATEIVFERCTVSDTDFNVLNHGDCWANNIMFQYDSEGNMKETYLVDLQMPRYGSPAQDLIYFIISSAHEDIKIQKFDYMIKYYYDNLIAYLKLLKYSKPLPTLRDIHAELINRGIWGFITITTVMGAVLSEPTDTANLDNFIGTSQESNKFKEILYSNERFVRHLKLVLPWLCNRGALEC